MRKIIFFFALIILGVLAFTMSSGPLSSLSASVNGAFGNASAHVLEFFGRVTTTTQSVYTQVEDGVKDVHETITEKVEDVKGAIDQVNNTAEQLKKTQEALSGVLGGTDGDAEVSEEASTEGEEE